VERSDVGACFGGTIRRRSRLKKEGVMRHVMSPKAMVGFIFLVAPMAVAQTPAAPPALPGVKELSSPDDTVRKAAIKMMEDAFAANPRVAAEQIYKKRLAGPLFDSGHYDEAADFTLLCIQKQPGQLDRVYYALTLRAKSLSKLGKHDEALATAKSLYNWCLVKDTPKAIDIIADCLTAAYPNDPGKAKRFKLQQLAGGSDQPSTLDLGPSIFAEIKVDPARSRDALTCILGAGFSGRRRC
jgi:hypothetical protein